MPPVIGPSTPNVVTDGSGFTIFGSGFPAEGTVVPVLQVGGSHVQMPHTVWFADPTNQVVIPSSAWADSGAAAPPSHGSESANLYFAAPADLATPLTNLWPLEVRATDWLPAPVTDFPAIHSPHNLPSDGQSNPAYQSGHNPHSQFPYAEVQERAGA